MTLSDWISLLISFACWSACVWALLLFTSQEGKEEE